MTRRWIGALAFAWLSTGCSPAAPPVNGGDSAPTTATVAASVDPAPSNAPEAPAKQDAAKLLSKLDEAKGELRLYQLGDAVLVAEDVYEGADMSQRHFTRMGAVTGGKIAWQKKLELPLPSHSIKGIEGSYPDALWLRYVFDHGRSADEVRYELTSAGWVAKNKKSSYLDYVFDSTTLAGGSVVGVTARDMDAGGRLTILYGLAKAPVIPKSDRCGPKGVWISAVEATDKGTLVGVGGCAGRDVAVVWAPDKTEGTLHFFEPTQAEGPSDDTLLLWKGRGDSMWVWFGGKVVHFVDGAWSAAEPGPVVSRDRPSYLPGGGVELANGEVWLYRGNASSLFRRTGAGVYQRVELPDAVSINGLATQDGKLLVAISNVLLGQGSGGVDWAQVKLDEKKEQRVIGARPASPACKNNVVVLYGFTKVTPEDYDFPLTRKALKGQQSLRDVTFAVTREAGQKFFVGLTPTFERAAALRDVIEKGVQGSSPQIVCAKPEILRELKIDLATGELAK